MSRREMLLPFTDVLTGLRVEHLRVSITDIYQKVLKAKSFNHGYRVHVYP